MKRKYVDTPLVVGPGTSYVEPEPYGVVCVIGTWNYPLATAIGPMIEAIGAGNCVIVKPSEMIPSFSPVFNKLISSFLDQNYYRCV